ncbi:hypothetical protein TG4357_03525 [Thalassovita gelatinovora]|uniref:Uncharacterized protein n=1 Tax=Thalassovita gelatinovora TaxID=53501 RepID=A0A0P1FKU2_THAGE|nr:hypothetical protein [Thalassovita gelatinovora]QIZ82320.1 hypothetical protein HFZ77_18475 [Thalassovita gelatinovora]CUH68372.1 hypothetical protein TG4357_03525 [Thalassovita gelatinovora]SER19173.1 hypothetical protein SAMN04488043_12015 [Thalassovita gelatinovora]
MQVVLHAGAHNTDEDRLIKCLLKNAGELSKTGVAVPGPSRYRRLIRDTLAAMETGQPSADSRELLIDAIVDGEAPDRLLLSNENFFSVPKAAINKGVIYPGAENKLARLCELFSDDQVELFLAIRNPATFLPVVFAQSPGADFLDFMSGADPRDIRWSELITRIRLQAPDVPMTIWCNEDTPMIWAQLIRDLAGLEHNAKIIGGFDLLSDIMSKEGMKRFRAYLKDHPDMNEIQKRRVIAAFLDKYVIEDEVEEEVDLPGWSDDLVDELTDLYDEDVFQISRIPGVTMVAP